jgi:hypothetical protein
MGKNNIYEASEHATRLRASAHISETGALCAGVLLQRKRRRCIRGQIKRDIRPYHYRITTLRLFAGYLQTGPQTATKHFVWRSSEVRGLASGVVRSAFRLLKFAWVPLIQNKRYRGRMTCSDVAPGKIPTLKRSHNVFSPPKSTPWHKSPNCYVENFGGGCSGGKKVCRGPRETSHRGIIG